MGVRLTNESVGNLIWKIPVRQILLIIREDIYAHNSHCITLADKEAIDGIE